MIKITTTIKQEHKDYLNKHPSINVSGLLQEAITNRMHEIDGTLSMDQFNIECENLHKNIETTFITYPGKALSIKSMARELGLPFTHGTFAMIRFALNDFISKGRMEMAVKGTEEYYCMGV